jgi:hypothetical protein
VAVVEEGAGDRPGVSDMELFHDAGTVERIPYFLAAGLHSSNLRSHDHRERILKLCGHHVGIARRVDSAAH